MAYNIDHSKRLIITPAIKELLLHYLHLTSLKPNPEYYTRAKELNNRLAFPSGTFADFSDNAESEQFFKRIFSQAFDYFQWNEGLIDCTAPDVNAAMAGFVTVKKLYETGDLEDFYRMVNIWSEGHHKQQMYFSLWCAAFLSIDEQWKDTPTIQLAYEKIKREIESDNREEELPSYIDMHARLEEFRIDHEFNINQDIYLLAREYADKYLFEAAFNLWDPEKHTGQEWLELIGVILTSPYPISSHKYSFEDGLSFLYQAQETGSATAALNLSIAHFANFMGSQDFDAAINHIEDAKRLTENQPNPRIENLIKILKNYREGFSQLQKNEYAATLEKIKSYQEQIILGKNDTRENILLKAGYKGSLNNERELRAFAFECIKEDKYDALILSINLNRMFLNERDNLHLAYAFFQTQNPYFDPQISKTLLETLSRLDGRDAGDAAHKLGFCYERGYFGSLDLELAKKYYKICLDKGTAFAGEAAVRIARINQMQSSQGVLTKEVIQSLEKYKDRESQAAAFLAEYYISGRGGEDMRAEGKRLYETIINFPETTTTSGIDKYHAVGIWGLRHLLGINTLADLDKARQLLNTCQTMSDRCDHCSHVYERAIQIIDQNPKDIERCQQILKGIYFDSDDPIEAFTHEQHSPSLHIFSYLFHHIKKEVEFHDLDIWTEISSLAQARALNETALKETSISEISLTSLRQSSLKVGPIYNRFSRNGLPVLGALEQTQTENHYVTEGAYVPAAGIVALKEIELDNNGMHFLWETDDEKPALIVAEDIEVLQILAFGSEEGPIYPRFSLENLDRSSGSSYKHLFAPQIEDKVFTPSWLIHTDFGRTLFFTDWLAGSIVWNQNEFEVADEIFSQNAIFSLLSEFRHANGIHLTYPERIMVTVGKADVRMEGDDKRFRIIPEDISLRLDGSYMYGNNDTLHLNDPRFSNGISTQVFSDNIKEISEILPVFERARQLMCIQHSLSKLRVAGYEPPNVEIWHKKLKEFEAMGAGSYEQRLCQSPPFYQRDIAHEI